MGLRAEVDRVVLGGNPDQGNNRATPQTLADGERADGEVSDFADAAALRAAGVGVADLSRFLIFSEMPFFSSSDWVVSRESSALAHARGCSPRPLCTACTPCPPPCTPCTPRCHAHYAHVCGATAGRLGLTLAAPILAIRS